MTKCHSIKIYSNFAYLYILINFIILINKIIIIYYQDISNLKIKIC